MFNHSGIPLWVNAFMVVLLAFMSIQVYWFYFDHQSLLDAGISIAGVPDLNIIDTTAGRLLAMIAATGLWSASLPDSDIVYFQYCRKRRRFIRVARKSTANGQVREHIHLHG